jgi:hypothetical protein
VVHITHGVLYKRSETASRPDSTGSTRDKSDYRTLRTLVRQARYQDLGSAWRFARRERRILSRMTPDENHLGDFYVQDTCCTSCGVPQAVAPDLVGWANQNLTQCYWIKQPKTPDELDRAVKLFQTQELGCHRYSGNDAAILQRLPAEDCDQLRPDLKLKLQPNFTSSGLSPTFSLSVSEENDLLRKLWRKLRRIASTPD